jgi:4-amino-4-deoxy-L-arabinose transferase-like glycosyltransferase
MRISFPTTWISKNNETAPSTWSRTQVMSWAALVTIVLLAAALRLANLDTLGLANHYYAAAVKSMLQSWHNFFFVAAEPGGSVSVDKPPLGLWLQTLSAAVFGINTFGLMLPQIAAGLLSVVVICRLVRRRFGEVAGLLAALALAITPVVVATDRNNTIDSTLILTLLLAAWAFIKATETARLRYLMVGAALVGIGFNIKMLEAYLPLPAFVLMYLLGAPEGLWRRIAKLALAGIVLLVISLSWAVAVDLTPASERPYVGSSGDNSELNLIVGYNGLNRLEGMFRGGGTGGGAFSPGGNPAWQRNPPGSSNTPPGNGPNRNGSGFGNSSAGRFVGRGGIGETGQIGPLRLFIPPLSKEASWLLPMGLLGLLLLVIGGRLAWPVVWRHQAAVLWGGWLITAGIFFSVAGFFHEYYLSTLAPPLAALVGIGVVEAWQQRQRHTWLATLLLLGAAGITLLLQYTTAIAFVRTLGWLPLVAVLFTLGTLAIIIANLIFLPQSARSWLATAGYAGLVVALLVTPGIWSVLTNLHSSDNQSLPAAYNGRSNGPVSMGQIQVSSDLLDFLQANTQDTTYLMAVPSSMQGADYVLATGRPVLYMGGFMGQDQVLTADSLAHLVESGQLRYIFSDTAGSGRFGGGRFGGGFVGIGQADISSWISDHCQAVQGYDVSTHNTGAPDGINGGTGIDGARMDMPVSLYDCGG